ncbi:MAG: DUF5317 family protein [Actinomycetes bacterium]
MVFTGLTLILALGVAVATRGSLGRITELGWRRPWLLGVGVTIQAGLEFVRVGGGQDAYVPAAVLLLSYACILGFCASNLRITGMGVILIGIALNATVIALNLGMPYRAPVGREMPASVKHRPERSDDVLTIISDRIVLPPLRTSISFGDLIIAVGLIDLCYRGSRRPSGAGTQARSSAASTLTS